MGHEGEPVDFLEDCAQVITQQTGNVITPRRILWNRKVQLC